MSDHATALSAGTLFGKYKIVRLLGEGGMGAVYEAVHTELEKRVALKTLHREYSMNADARARFIREGRAASKIRHPHVVDVTDVGTQDGMPFMVMAFLEGESLEALLERERALPVERVADILLPVCDALATAHAAGIVHRDLKPANIFMTRQAVGTPIPIVVDFGIAKLNDGIGVKTQGSMGTVLYMSPEQMRHSGDVDARTDQYSIGVVLYEAVTGRRPVEGTDFGPVVVAVMEGTYRPPREIRPDIPPGFESIVLRAMSVDRERRFSSMRALGAALLPFTSAKVRMVWGEAFSKRLTSGEFADPDDETERAPVGVRQPMDAETALGAAISAATTPAAPSAGTEHAPLASIGNTTLGGAATSLSSEFGAASSRRGRRVPIVAFGSAIVLSGIVAATWITLHQPRADRRAAAGTRAPAPVSAVPSPETHLSGAIPAAASTASPTPAATTTSAVNGPDGATTASNPPLPTGVANADTSPTHIAVGPRESGGSRVDPGPRGSTHASRRTSSAPTTAGTSAGVPPPAAGSAASTHPPPETGRPSTQTINNIDNSIRK